MFDGVLKFVNLKSIGMDGLIAFRVSDNDGVNQVLKQELMKCIQKYNGMVKIRIQPPYKPRTTGKNSQNHKLNGSIAFFCAETGNDFDDIKMYIKRRALRRGYPCKKDKDGNILISKVDGNPIPISESDANTLECSYLIEEMIQLAAEMDVILPENPDYV